MNEVYNGGFAPEFSVSVSKQTIALVRDYVYDVCGYVCDSPVLKALYSKVFSEFLRPDSQSSYSFGKIQNVGDSELSEEKI